MRLFIDRQFCYDGFMSKENADTLKIYDDYAKVYLQNTINNNRLNPVETREVQNKLNLFLERSFSKLPKSAEIIEIGAGDGVCSDFLRSLGYKVTASDVAEDFLKAIRSKGLDCIKLNVLEDKFPQNFSGVLAWRVFVHFDSEDLKITFKKIVDALQPGGRFVFNILNNEDKQVQAEWVDFPGKYQMGVKRFFAYHAETEIKDLIQENSLELVDFFKEGGETGKRWLCFVTEKTR